MTGLKPKADRSGEKRKRDVRKVIAAIKREQRERTLDGLSIRDMIEKGRR